MCVYTYLHESASNLLVHAVYVIELARPLAFFEEFASGTCMDQSISNPIVLARPLSISGVPAQQLPSTLNYINDNFDPISYTYVSI